MDWPVLVASMIYFLVFMDHFSFHELMITLFLLLTAPITGNLLAKAHMHSRMRKDDLPPTGVTDDWATFDKDGPSRLLSDLDTQKS